MNYNNYDTSYNSYGGGGGGGGGGFIPGDGSQTSPSNKRDYSQDTLRPVTIKQLLDAQEVGQEFKVDGAVVSQLTFVGQIRNIAMYATNATYRLDDGTGSIEVKQLIDADAVDQPSANKGKLVENMYCRAWGKLKSFNAKKHVYASVLRPIEDYNEISFHLLQATFVHLYHTRGPPGAAGSGGGAVTNGGQGQQGNMGGGGAGDLSSYNAVAKKVYNYLHNAEQSNEGLHQQTIAAALGVDTAEVARAGDDLLAGGLIYTTVDDQTWAVLEAD
ncbi:replication protein A, subunit RPA32 [Lophiostoma macrostomum CBS 122681]|uniref:Replication protein A, subunit RPA32 n=1 Tax=Lophiostoma macrostomum CBS 122681 TaxID=1314788 RepID=A0A6A6TPX4_9PLEO|nr:replication protein A, subunit RPA32 [Lophiostoma macrostomum CBS 122681]